jgi:hypothetical protein
MSFIIGYVCLIPMIEYNIVKTLSIKDIVSLLAKNKTIIVIDAITIIDNLTISPFIN